MSNLSFIPYVGNGNTKEYGISFTGADMGYLRQSDVKVLVDGVQVSSTINTASPHLVILDEAPPVGSSIIVRREMPVDTPYADFSRGNNFGYRQVNNSFLQQLYLTQEILDGFKPEGYYEKQDLNLGGFKITDVGYATSDKEAATLGQVNSLIDSASNLDGYSAKIIDYLELKIFQSPTDGGLTEIQTRTVDANEVYEVRKTSDDSLATIYSDAAGTTEIVQDGTSNVSDSAGVVEFYIADGDYYVEVGGVRAGLFVSGISATYYSISEAGATNLKLSSYVRLTDRGNGLFKVLPVGSTANGFDRVGLANGLVLDYVLEGELHAKHLGAKFDYNASSKVGTDDTAALQGAIDYGNSLYIGGSFGGGGIKIILPAGNTKYSGLEIKRGVSLVGQGSGNTNLFLSGASSEGLRCAAADTGSYTGQVARGSFIGFSMFSAENAPTSQVQWNIIGFSRWYTEDVLFEWFNGCTGIRCKGATLAGKGGAAQWYNTFNHAFLLRTASRPAGGVAADLGDTDIGKEQITAMTWIGGRWSGSGGGTGLSLRGTGNSFVGVTFEGLDTAMDIGSTGTRGASGNNFTGCYWEGNTTNRRLRSNAINTSFVGSFITGGTDIDDSKSTIFNETGRYRAYQANSTAQTWEVFTENPLTTRPRFKSGNSVPAFDLTNSAGSEITFNNGLASSSSTSAFRVLWNDFTDVLLAVGSSQITAGTDGLVSVGSAANRFSTVYAASGSINTSDERLKTALIDIEEAEKACAMELKKSIKKFKFNSAIELKGDKARIHFGVGAQTVRSIFESHGLDADQYAMFCYDEWEDEFETFEAVLDEEGNELEPERTVQIKEAGNRYGIRYDELCMFILSSL